ncbi:hypothetical protein LDENG_00041680, partial [Lucifuga dentata]
DDFFKNLNILSIDPETAAGLERAITTLEIDQAIRSMQSSKSPGPDGYPSKFFKKSSTQLSPLLLSVFEESLLSHSYKDPLECSSYWPISLLNTDAKILSEVLAQ